MTDSLRIQAGAPEPQGPGEDPLYYYNRLLVRFLQLVFASFDKNKYHWELDENLTEIIISDQATVAKETAERRPAVIVARGGANFGNVAMDQFAGPLLSKKTGFVANEDPVKGSRRYTDLISASSSFNCISSEGVEAQRLAWICSMAVRRLKRSLMRAGFHRIGEEVQIGPESSPGAIVQPDPGELIMVSVSIPFWFQDFWTIEPVDKVLLKKLDLNLRSEVNYAPGELALNAPAINGRILEYDRDKVLSLTQRVHITTARTPKPRK